MELEAQLASHGVYCGDPAGYESPEAGRLEAGAKDRRLLLQLDSDEHMDVMWGDAGILYLPPASRCRRPIRRSRGCAGCRTSSWRRG